MKKSKLKLNKMTQHKIRKGSLIFVHNNYLNTWTKVSAVKSMDILHQNVTSFPQNLQPNNYISIYIYFKFSVYILSKPNRLTNKKEKFCTSSFCLISG